MFTPLSQRRSHDGASQDCKDISEPGSKMEKKAASTPLPCASAFKHRPLPRLFPNRLPLDASPCNRPLSVIELPRLIAQVGSERAMNDTKWTKGPRLMASALGTDIPVGTSVELTPKSLTGEEKSIQVTASNNKKRNTVNKGKDTKPKKVPLTVTEVLHILLKEKDKKDSKMYYLKKVEGDSYRPYNLQVVQSRKDCPEYYIFSSDSVHHMTGKGYGEIVSLTEWYRESLLWTALQDIPFFRTYSLQKAFTWWHKIVRRRICHRRCKVLQNELIMVMPQFRNACLMFNRVFEELRKTHLLPLKEKTYTLSEFKNMLKSADEEVLEMLKKLSLFRSFILNKVRDDCHRANQELQLHVKYFQKPSETDEPLHQHMAHYYELVKERTRSENALNKLGDFAAVINHMTVQSIVTITKEDITAFLNNILKKQKSKQVGLFGMKLCPTNDSGLTVEPSILLCQTAVSEAFLSVGEAVIKMCDSCGLFLERNSSVQDSDEDDFCTEYLTFTEKKSNDEVSGGTQLCCQQYLKDLPSSWPVSSNEASETDQGNTMSCYNPLTRGQLEWQISINDVTKHLAKEHVKIMQEAQADILQLCKSYSWIQDIHLFTTQWSRASLEAMMGQPNSLYEELINKLRLWIDRIHTVPSSVTTSNNLFVIQCTSLKEHLGMQVRVIEEEVKMQLAEQIELQSESLLLELEEASSELEADPKDLHDLSQYAQKFRESTKTLDDTQKRLDYIHALQHTVCKNYRELTDQERALDRKLLVKWEGFLLLLKHAENIICDRLPYMSHALDSMFSFSICSLKNIASKATSGPFLDPTQDAKETVSSLIHMCEHVHNLSAKLEKMSQTSQDLRGHPMDLSSVTADIKQIEARKELWELMYVCKSWMEQWKQLPFSEVVVSQTQEKIAKWREQALSLTSIVPTTDAVFQKVLRFLGSLSPHLAAMAQLQSTTLKQKHWNAIFIGMGLLYDPERKVMVAELMSEQYEVNWKLITKICGKAQEESDIEQNFLNITTGWKSRLFQLDKFFLPVWEPCEPRRDFTREENPTEGTHSNLESTSQQSTDDIRSIILGLDSHLAEIENDLMSLSVILKSPYAVEFKQQVEEWIQALRDLDTLFHLMKKYQQTWAFLTKMLHGSSLCLKRDGLLKQFQPADETFKELLHCLSVDPHVLNLVQPKEQNDKFRGESLHQILTSGLSTMDAICTLVTDQMDTLIAQFPRLWFLSNSEAMQLLSSHPTHDTLQVFIRRCFKGVCWLEVDFGEPTDEEDVESCETTATEHRRIKVLGIFGSHQEHITFLSPLESNVSPLAWLSDFEKHLRSAMVQLMNQCSSMQSQLEPHCQALAGDKHISGNSFKTTDRKNPAPPELGLLSEHPLQCVLVVEELVWATAVLKAFQYSSPRKLSSINIHISEKLDRLGFYLRRSIIEVERKTLLSRYTMMCLRALVQLTIKHAQQLSKLMEIQHFPLESSFEWQSLMKYCIMSEDTDLRGKAEPTCFIDVLGHRLQYDYEYFGPEDLEMVHTQSTDQAQLGILLALTSYKCGFVSGPPMSGKKTTVVQLGKALGRQIVNIKCGPSMRPDAVQRMLWGAVSTGAWLLFDCVHTLKQRVLSVLEQHLEDIHLYFSTSTRNKTQGVKNETKDGAAECKTDVDSAHHMVLAGKSISARLNYGCVFVSSKGYLSEVPQSLRCATRPITLSHPDYRVIAEVMLTSIGFSEAMSLSRHLVSLISLAKDSNCLPGFITNDQSCYLVVLQRIISASEIHLQQSARERGISALPNLASSQNVEQTMPSRFADSESSVIFGLMEETAVVKAVLSVFYPFLYEQKKAAQFSVIFEETFPIVSQFLSFRQYIEEEEKTHLNDAVARELRSRGLQSNTGIINHALTLYHNIRFSQAVLLVGPPGSGKTVCYSALAGALNLLTSRARARNGIKEFNQRPEPTASILNWNSVNTVVLFPNTMSNEELFGFIGDRRGWKDGAVAKVVLRDSDQHEKIDSICKNTSDHTSVMKWLVMDGEPLGQPGWLDHLAPHCTPEDAFLRLPSCENLRPEPEFKLLIETSNLEDASPSAVTLCGLVYFTGTDLWKAVWKSEIKALTREFNLDQKTLKLWKRLAEDLFSSTLSSLKDCALESAIFSEGQLRKCPMNGLQEIMSVVRIIRALLQHYGMEVGTAEAALKTDERGSSTKKDLLAKNIFLVAYIWGFSGLLHRRHLPQFDLLVRQLLFSCRYKIIVPDEESVFDCFFDTKSRATQKTSMLTSVIIPKYGKCTFLLNLMLEANQPALLAGEVGSGKTTLCKALLGFQTPHISLPASPLLSSRELRTLVGSIKHQENPDHAKDFRKKQPRLLLFVDDLHEAPCDVFGKTSTALETLRQCISTGGIVTYDSSHVKSLSSRFFSYMATCRVLGSGSHQSTVMSPRLSRLFSIFVLPSLSLDVIFSIHSPRLKTWLKEMPLKCSCEVMAHCVITATKTLYDAVREQFQPTAQRPHVIFSHHDIQKVFWGMCLWQPKHDSQNTATKEKNSLPGFPLLMSEPAALSFDIAHLWMHECMRTFSDRLGSQDEHGTLVSLVCKTATAHYGILLIDETQPTSSGDPPMNNGTATDTLPAESTSKPSYQRVDGVNTLNLLQEPTAAGQSKLQKCHPQTEPSPLSEDIHSEQAKLKTDSSQPHIIQYMKDIVTKLVYGPELSKASKSTNNIDSSSIFYQNLDLNIALKELHARVNREEEKNVQNDIFMTRYMLHRQRVNQLLHILRVLLIPGGHGLLISSERGTGRKTNVRLAASLMGYQLMEVHPGNESRLHQILKRAGNQTRKDGANVIILAHEGISQPVRDGLLVAMAHRTYPGLYTDEELRNLVSTVTAVKNSTRYALDSWTFEKFLSQIHRNVHVFLLLPFIMQDSNEMHANKRIHGLNAQLTKALSCSFCVEVYQPWSKQSLEEGAAQCLEAYLHKKEGEGLAARLSAVIAEIHQSACQCASVHLTAQPFSPRTYMEFITNFSYLYKHMCKQQQSQADRVATAVSKLDVISNTEVECTNNVLRLQVEVSETQRLEKKLLSSKEYHMNRLMEAKKTCIEEEQKISYIREGGIPFIQSGVKIMKSLNPFDLEEVRHYRDPPDGVVKLMDAICLLFDRSPGWENAKQLLGRPNFFQEMEFFDRYSLTKEQLQQLGQIVKSPQFVPESVREVSKACESLCRWVQAVYECCCMQQQLSLKPPSQGDAVQRLCKAMQDKTDACYHLERIEPQLQDARKRFERQMEELRTAGRLEKETAKTVELMETRVTDWRAAALENELKNKISHGDALLLAAAISYLGPFGPDTRTELLSKWSKLCQAGDIEVNSKGLRTSMLSDSDTGPSNPLPGFPITVSESLQPHAGWEVSEQQDAPKNGVIVKLLLWACRRAWAQRWLLLVDPHQNLDVPPQSWCIPGRKNNQDQEREFRLVVCADDPKLLDKLDQAAVQGLTVMVTHIELAVPSPQFLARLTRPAGRFSPAPGHHIQRTHPKFCLFLVTNQPVKILHSAIHPSILARVGVVDLSLSSEEIQELMLMQLLQSECKDLLIQQLQFQNDKQLLQEKLVSEEEALMGYIRQSNTTLLHDSDFHRRAAACQETMESLRAEIQQLSNELEYHRSLLAVPRQLMKLATDFYQDLQDVSRLSPAYDFSLCGFVAILQEACIVKDRPLVPFSIRKVPKDVIPEVTNRMVTQLLLKYRPQLLKSHFAVLKVLMSLTLLRHNQLCSEAERMAFIRGFSDTLTLTNMEPHLSITSSTCATPSWIPPNIRPELHSLEKMPGFEGLIASLSSCPTQWQEYLTLPPSAVVGAVPCHSHSHLSVLQRALLWRIINQDCLESLTEAMAVYQPLLLGQTGGIEAPHTGNPKALLQAVSTHKGPITLILPSPSTEERTHIQPLHLISTMANCVEDTKEVEVKVITFGAIWKRENILSMLNEAVDNGHWLVFNNCHLLEKWDDAVIAGICQSVFSVREEQTHIHPVFQLWFITQESALCSVPAAVRMRALPLVCGSPWNLKDELSSSFGEVVSVMQNESLWNMTADNKGLLLRCAIFHSVLLQRQRYKYLGQGRIYSWSRDDLLALMDTYLRAARHCHDRVKAVKCIAVNLVHGGHVLDPAELEVMESVAETCFSTESPLTSKGPHLLSDLIFKHGNIDLSELHQVLEKNSADINDLLTLGFSHETLAWINKINSHVLNIQLKASQTPSGTARSLSTKLIQSASLLADSQAREQLQALKNFLTLKNNCTDSNAGALSPGPLRDFLQAEWDDLINSVSFLLSRLQLPVQYNTLTFASLLDFPDLSRLKRRAELLSAYLFHLDTSDPPGAYRLAAFKNARGFLSAVMREAAQFNRTDISDISQQFEVLSDSTIPETLALDSVYLCGLELRGASWNTQLGALQDTRASQPCSLPLVCVKTEFTRDTLTSKLVRDAQIEQTSAACDPQLPLFNCPVYLERDEESGNCKRADVDIITTVPLHAELNPLLCNLRSVRIVSML